MNIYIFIYVYLELFITSSINYFIPIKWQVESGKGWSYKQFKQLGCDQQGVTLSIRLSGDASYNCRYALKLVGDFKILTSGRLLSGNLT